MSRFFFHILTDPGDGDLEFDTSIDVGDLAVDLDGSPSGLSFTQVGDGYYFDYTVSGLYTISISAVDQDEFTNIPLVADEDNVNTQMLQSVKGYIYASGGYLRVYTDGSSALLDASDVVNDDTTGGAAVPASAEIVKTLGSEIDDLQAQLIASRGGGGGGGGDRVVFVDSNIAAATANAAASALTEFESDENDAASYQHKVVFPYYRRAGEKYLTLFCQIKTESGVIGRVAFQIDSIDSIGQTSFGNAGGAVNWSDLQVTINLDTEDDLADQPVDIGMHLVYIDLGSWSGGGSVFMREPIVVASGNALSITNPIVQPTLFGKALQ